MVIKLPDTGQLFC